MATKKISELTTAATLDGSEVFELVQTGDTFKCVVAQIAVYAVTLGPVATTSVNGAMSAADKTKLNGIAASANNYTHPAGDGNLHVPATGTTNNGRFLQAGATAGSLSWAVIPNATTSVAGLMSGADKTKLDGVAAGANNYTLPVASATIGGVKIAAAVADVATPASATAEDVANKVNALLASLRASGALTA